MEALAGLFVASFAAATLFPLPSEAALFAYLKSNPESAVLGIAVATIGNTAGGMTTYLVGRVVPEKMQARLSPNAVRLLRKYGAVATLLAWLPVVGDALAAAAGWLRIGWPGVLAFMAAGRLARYIAVAALT